MSAIAGIRSARQSKAGSIELLNVVIGHTVVLVRRDVVSACQAINEIDKDEPVSKSIGWIRVNQQRYPVYSLTEELDFSNKIDENRKLCLVVPDAACSILCDEIKPVLAETSLIYELPECMSTSATPVASFYIATNGSKMETSMLFTPESLAKFIRQMRR